MEPSIMEKVFDPYFTTKQVNEGSGLGLAVVQGIVKRLDGAVVVRSEPGKGSTFEVYLPQAREVSLAKESQPKSIPGGTEHILFIDDEEALTRAAKATLERLGYRITVSLSGAEALHSFRSEPDLFDLVITDYTMPGMTGADLAKEILEIRPDIPIILCTGFSEQINEEKARIMGVKEYILKPAGRLQLAETVRKALNK
jgi:CheY-like chemotaxis protein